MGRPSRGKGTETMEAVSHDDDDDRSEEAAAARAESIGRPQKPPKDDDDGGAHEVEDTGHTATAKPDEENGDVVGIKPVVVRLGRDSIGSSTSEAAGAGSSKKKKRPLKRGSDESAGEDELAAGRAKSKTNGFRHVGSRRRKSTPRRAAEAGVECK